MRAGGLTVAQHDSSDMPHSSQIGRPRAPKNSSTSIDVGAAPDTDQCTSSRPIWARILERTISSALAYSASRASSGPGPVPLMAACSARTFWIPVATAHCSACLRCGSGSVSMLASRAALIFSHTRGTAPQIVGRMSARAAAMVLMSATQVIWRPKTICW